MTPARELGEQVTRRWRRADFDERAFPAIAAEVLAAAGDVSELVDVRQLALARQLPEPSRDALGAGGSELALYRNGRVAVRVCLASDLGPAMVRPRFAGAMRMAGRFLCAGGALEPTREVHSGLAVGRIEPRGVEALADGDVRRIEADDPVGRSLVGLAPGGAVVVVATDELVVARELRYLRPSVAIALGRDDPAERRRRQLLVTAARALPAGEGDALLADILDRADVRETLLVLVALAEARPAADRDVDLLAGAVARAVSRHGARIPGLRELVADARRTHLFASILQGARDEADRLALAAVLMAPMPAAVDARLRGDAPGAEPADRVIGALSRAAERSSLPEQRALLGDRWSRHVAAEIRAWVSDPAPGRGGAPGATIRRGLAFGAPMDHDPHPRGMTHEL